jgi:hypothetical protein
MITKNVLISLILVLVSAGSANAQSLNGSLFLYNPKGQDPIPLNNYEVSLMDNQRGKWLDPSVTDVHGRFSFQGVKDGEYTLYVHSTGPYWKQQLYQRSVKVPGTLNPIVLPSAFSIVPHAAYKELSPKTYSFRLWISVPEERKKDIRKVTYFFNHPTFTKKELTARNASNSWGVVYNGWGCLTKVVVNVSLDSETVPIAFNMCEALKRLSSENEFRSKK